ncbi:MAG: tetratricopeptide repeat protein, partial [Deltaproteobacteria bacterium]
SILETYRRIHGPDHPRTMAAVANLANDLYEQGDLARAADLQLQVLDSSRRVYGPKHPNTLELMVNLANTRASQKDYAEAERINREVLATELEARGPAGRTAGIVRYNLLCEAALQHHREDALRYLQEAVQYGMPEEIVRNIDQDPDLESLRGDRTYGELVAQLKARPAP